ncbi:MAG TPA: LacI family DNA-binding transcriptional regulator [Abditibacteriaceae bacterium]
MKDVALRAGVHHSSVSVVLNGSRSSAGISSSTRQRILEAAEELGYRRNGSAHTIRTGRFGNVALLLSARRSHSYLPPQLLAGLHEALSKADMTLTVCLLPDEELAETSTLPKILRERMCDGLLIDYNFHIPQPMIDSIQRYQIPATWINSEQEYDCVRPDDFKAAVEATEYLLKLGHRRIVYVDFANDREDPQGHYSVLDRSGGYESVMRQAGLKSQLWDSKLVGSDPIGFCEEMLRTEQRPTAIVSYATYAMEAASYAAARLGYRVPDDLSVVSFGPDTFDYMCRPMTLWIEPQYQIGQAATRMLLSKIGNPIEPIAPQAVAFGFMEGKTTARNAEYFQEPILQSATETSSCTQSERQFHKGFAKGGRHK